MSTSITSSSKSTTSTASTTKASLATPSEFRVCSGDTSSTDGVQQILDQSGAVDWLDIMLISLPDGEKDWVNKLWDTVFHNDGVSPLTGCGEIGSDCNPKTACSDYPQAMAYWVFRTVGILHSKVNTVRSNLLWTGWLDGLSIDQIGEDFTPPVPDTSWVGWIAACFTMAGGAATAVDASVPLVGMLGMASGAMSAVSMEKGDDSHVDTTSVQNTLKNIVGAAGEEVANILQKATGNADPETLPIYTYTMYQHATSRFFADSTLLLDENKDNSSFASTYSLFTDNLEKKLVDVALKTAWYLLLADTDISEDDCTDTGYLWLEAQSDQYYCFYWTVAADTRYCEDDDPTTCDSHQWSSQSQFDESFYSKLEKYGFDLKSYYTSLIDCKVNGNGESDTKTYINGAPRCFYNNFVRTGHWKTDYGGPLLSLDSDLGS
ncbi:hypothetical protein N7517_000896 [Penicillium concentricum]|uniref:Uncharacterized protein n=1 Tax=Penicillium concentricum TaxID=293559 RepID=A0A9W9SR09_9EURO|nr:uncharacterized protein N7517_000896 [Penicillium concentricum]KAJ5382985.1 hypothetical protein N7517_000896 [Penicillium concentricum]